MSEEKYLQDLKEIRVMMSKSSRFISLSGLSGVSAGVIALLGAAIAYKVVYTDVNFTARGYAIANDAQLFNLLGIALLTLLVALLSALFFTRRKTKKAGEKMWSSPVKSLLANLFIPMAIGGMVCLYFFTQGYIALLAPFTLIFYGLALLNASKYTLKEIKSLGIAQAVLGLFSLYFLGYGLLFWAVGFGVLHIVYGTIMHFRYQE